MRVIVISPPDPVVTWEAADAHLELSGDTDQQTKVLGMIAAATGHIDGPDGWLGRALGVQTLEARFDAWEVGQGLCLPCPPVISIESVTWRNAQRQWVTADPANYELIDRSVDFDGASPWDGGHYGRESIRVRYRAGYVEDPEADPLVAKLPAPIRAAILLMLGDLYMNRETVAVGVSAAKVPMSTTVEDLLGPYRMFS
ncbi:MAG: hypothetical protein V4618_00830 [Pseudomonadota bacterium]